MTIVSEPLEGHQLSLFELEASMGQQVGQSGPIRKGASNILVGTCAWSDHANFYPNHLKPTERLPYYAQFFPIVEVDSTFYHIQSERNFQGWAERTPDYFKFNVKAYKALTLHERLEPFETADALRARQGQTRTPKIPHADTFERFSASLQPLREAGKLRAVHFQFPPWFTFSPGSLEYLETVRAFFPRDLIAIEFRHRSWLDEIHRAKTMQTLRLLSFCYVIVDEPQIGTGSVPPVVEITNPELTLFRFHGRNLATWYKPVATTAERFDYLYSKAELDEWMPKINQVAQQAHETHVLFNNCTNGSAVVNGRQLLQMLEI